MLKMCSVIVSEWKCRRFVIGIMKLISVHTYCTTRAYKLNFFFFKEDRYLSARIFENSAVFEYVARITKGRNYAVVGWLNNKIIEVIDIN